MPDHTMDDWMPSAALLVLVTFLSTIFFLLLLLCLCSRCLSLFPDSYDKAARHDMLAVLAEQDARDHSDVMATWSEAYRQRTELAWAFERTHPPGNENADFTNEQLLCIRERGVSSWCFLPDPQGRVLVQDQTELVFHDDAADDVCVQTNLPLPRVNDVYYFEVKLMDKLYHVNVGIGLSTKPYPFWRFPGRSKHSVGFHTADGRKYLSDPYEGRPYSAVCHEGDVVGCGYRPRTGTVFFTRNGVKLDVAYTGIKMNLFPTVAADGPCTLEVNLGQAGFVLIEANVKKWGLAPLLEAVAAPPAYGQEAEAGMLLERGHDVVSSHRAIRYTGMEGAPELEVLLELTPSEPPAYLAESLRKHSNADDLDTLEEVTVVEDVAAYEARL